MFYHNPPLTQKKKKNSFSVSFYSHGQHGKGNRVLFLLYVNHVNKAIHWAFNNNIKFDYVNIYERRTRIFLGRYYINQKPQY